MGIDIHDLVFEYASRELEKKKAFIPGKTYIYPASPSLSPEDVAVLSDVVLQLWYTEWKYCSRFERAISAVTGKQFVSLTNSGSSANLLALTAVLKNKPSGYVITTALSFPTTVSPIYQNGHTPLYIDIMPDLTPNLEQLKAAIEGYRSEKIYGAIFGHFLGFPYQEKAVKRILHDERFLISDCCDAFGGTMDGEPVGSYADISTVSFFPSHHIMTAEGGAVMTNDYDLSIVIRSLSNWGRSCYCLPGQSNTCGHRFDWPNHGSLPDGWDHKYIFSDLGYNLKMTEFQAALGVSQIERLAEFVAARRENYEYLYSQLHPRDDLREHLSLLDPAHGYSPFGFPIRVVSEVFTVNEMIAYLEDHKVGTRRMFAGNLTDQPGFRNRPYDKYSLDVTDDIAYNSFWISVSPSLTTSMMDYMIYCIDQFLISKGVL